MSATPSTPSKSAAASLEEGSEKGRTQGGDKSGNPVVKTETSMKRPRRSPSRGEDNDDSIASSPSPLPPSTAASATRSGDKRSSKYRRYVKKKEREEGEDSDESVDSESDSDDSDESHSRSDMMRYPRRERRRRSPGNAPTPRGGGDQHSKIPTVCRHFLNGKLDL